MKIEDLRKKMSDWDFSKHTHTIEEFKSEQGNTVRIDHLREGNSNMGYVRFVNDDYGLSVYGDFGNWIFCRPFVPSKDGYVSVMYWNEKLHISSKQDHARYDSKETEKELKLLIEEIHKNKDDYTKPEEEIEFYTKLIECVDDELEYTYNAFRNYPSWIDPECIPFEKKGSYQLLIVFDAFNEICNRLQND